MISQGSLVIIYWAVVFPGILVREQPYFRSTDALT